MRRKRDAKGRSAWRVPWCSRVDVPDEIVVNERDPGRRAALLSVCHHADGVRTVREPSEIEEQRILAPVAVRIDAALGESAVDVDVSHPQVDVPEPVPLDARAA